MGPPAFPTCMRTDTAALSVRINHVPPAKASLGAIARCKRRPGSLNATDERKDDTPWFPDRKGLSQSSPQDCRSHPHDAQLGLPLPRTRSKH